MRRKTCYEGNSSLAFSQKKLVRIREILTAFDFFFAVVSNLVLGVYKVNNIMFLSLPTPSTLVHSEFLNQISDKEILIEAKN